MGLKKYITLSVIFIAVVGALVFSITSTTYEATLFGRVFSFPIAVWFVIPLILLFVASVLHILFYWLKALFSHSLLAKDEKNIIILLKNKLLKKEEAIVFNSPVYKEIAEVLSQVNVDIQDNFSSKNTEIESIAKDIVAIKNKKYVQTNYKLPLKNEIAIENNINKINEQANWALEVLKKSKDYSQEEVKTAFSKVLEEKGIVSLKKVLVSFTMDKQMILELFEKNSKENSTLFSKEEMLSYLKELDFTKDEFIEFAKIYKNQKDMPLPDNIIGVFEELSSTNDLALEAYVYILFEYEMIDKIRDILSNTPKEELLAYRALMDLKDIGKHYTLDSISYKN